MPPGIALTAQQPAAVTGDEISCPLCAYVTARGLRVCRGCGGDIVYGATTSELRAAMIVGGIVGGLITGIFHAPGSVITIMGIVGAFAGVMLRLPGRSAPPGWSPARR